MWDLIVSVPDHCLSFYFPAISNTYRNLPLLPAASRNPALSWSRLASRSIEHVLESAFLTSRKPESRPQNYRNVSDGENGAASSKVCILLHLIYHTDIAGIVYSKSKKISNDQELIQSDPIYRPQNQKGNN